MQNDVYGDETWEEERTYEREYVLNNPKFNARTKEPAFWLSGKVLSVLSTIRYNIPELYDEHLKIALKYAGMCNEDNTWGWRPKDKFGPLEARFFFNHDLYFLYWCMNDERQKDCREAILDCIRKDYLKETKKRDRTIAKLRQQTNIELCTRFGEFELAKQEFEKYSDIREAKIEKDTVYDPYRFYFLLLDYFTNRDKHEKEKISELFLYYFSEHGKLNYTLWSRYKLFGTYNIYYIYYKYFLELQEEEVTAYNVLRSGENGVCFWRK